MQISDQVLEVIKCSSCYRGIEDRPVSHNNEWYHAACYAAGRQRLQYARALAASCDFHALLYKRW